MQVIPISNIHYSREGNDSRAGDLFKSDKDLRGLCQTLGNGWFPPTNVHGLVLVTEADAKIKEVAKTARESELAAFEASDTVISLSIQGKTVELTESAEVADAYREMYFSTTKKTKKSPAKTTVKAVDFEGCTGYRRNSALPYVNAGLKKIGLKMILEIPTLPTQFGSELERLNAVIGENTTPNLGRRPLETADVLKAGWKLFSEGAQQTVFRMHWKDGMGQKIFHICRAHKGYFVDNKDPKDQLNVIGFLSANPDKFKSVKQDELAKKVTAGLTTEEIAEYIHDPKAGRANTAKPKMASRANVDAMASQHGLKIVAFIYKSILEDDVQRINRLNPIQDQLNNGIDQILVENKVPLPWGEEKAKEPTSA